MTIFLRVLEAAVDEKAATLSLAIATLREGSTSAVDLDPTDFTLVPGSPFAYWVSHSFRTIFHRRERFASAARTVRQGLATADDFRFLRTWWEIDSHGFATAWFNFAKGGSFSPFYADIPLLLEWRDAGATLKAKVIAEYGNTGKRIYNEEFYFHSGVTWPLRTNGLSFRAMPKRCIFGHKGPAALIKGDHPDRLLALVALMNSAPFGYLVGIQLARTELAQSYEVGLIQQTPVPGLSEAATSILEALARHYWSLKRTLDTTNETSHAFVLPPGTIGYEAVAPHEQSGGFNRSAIESELVEIQRQIDDLAFELYGIGPEDRAAIENASKQGSGSETTCADDDEDDSSDAPIGVPVLPVYSWLVGVAFGRFDKRLATGERPIPPEPEPFDPLPARSPGMWPEGEPRPIEPPGILVDDLGHDADLCAHVARAAEGTGFSVPDDLRKWLAREFFPLHIKMYSKSRRKAPIYWQLATPSASYSVWLYLHAFTKDSLFQVQNDYVAPKLAHEARKLDSMRLELGATARAADRKALAAQESFVEELRAFLEEVKRVAPLWNPELDDGVIINFAPLWRLVPHHKPWQKELKATWDALCEGKYDWAHLAMHLWPERVVPKCAKDRSLAIAHGLEDVFWVEGADGKWKPRPAPTRPVEELVAERTSAAVKESLRSLLEAPVAAGTAKRRGKGKGKR